MAINSVTGKQYFYEQVDVTLDGSGDGTTNVTFPLTFKNAPVVFCVPLLGGAGSLAANSITKTGFTFAVTGDSGVADQTVAYVYIAHEKL